MRTTTAHDTATVAVKNTLYTLPPAPTRKFYRKSSNCDFVTRLKKFRWKFLHFKP